jgi:hypothetical protein
MNLVENLVGPLFCLSESQVYQGRRKKRCDPGLVFLKDSSGNVLFKQWVDLTPYEKETWLKWKEAIYKLQQQVIDFVDMAFEAVSNKADSSVYWTEYDFHHEKW